MPASPPPSKIVIMTRNSLRLLLTFAALNATSLATHAQATHEHAKAPASPSLRLRVDGKTATYTVADLNLMPQKTITVHNEHTKADETYSGIALRDLLAKSGLPVEQATHKKILQSYLTAEGTDHYWVVYSVTEVEPSEHTADVIVATTLGGKPPRRRWSAQACLHWRQKATALGKKSLRHHGGHSQTELMSRQIALSLLT